MALHEIRERAPIYRYVSPTTGRVSWLLTRYAEVQKALRDGRLGRDLNRLPKGLAAVRRQWDDDPLPMVRRNVFNLDPPDHTRLRRLLTPAFSARAIARVEPRIQHVVDELVESLAVGIGGVDLIEMVALPFPSAIMAELIGFPMDEHDQFRAWSNDILRGRDVRAERPLGDRSLSSQQFLSSSSEQADGGMDGRNQT